MLKVELFYIIQIQKMDRPLVMVSLLANEHDTSIYNPHSEVHSWQDTQLTILFSRARKITFSFMRW